MAFVVAGRRSSCSTWPWLGWIVALVCVWAQPSCAERSTFRLYDSKDGLTSSSGECMLQDRSGYILACTEHGIFAYDGRNFINLGVEQGLRQGGFVRNIALTSTGRVAVGFTDEVLISDPPSNPPQPPSGLTFHSVLHPGLKLYDDELHRMAPWQDSLALVLAGETFRVALPATGAPHLVPMAYSPAEHKLLEGAILIFSAGGRLWEEFGDDRLCSADPGHVKCYGKADGLRQGPWRDVSTDADGHVLARSPSSVAVLHADTGRWSVSDLPDQGGRYLGFSRNLGLFKTPDGTLITQAEHGLLALHRSVWSEVTIDDGAPAGIITYAMTDATGELWFDTFGRGLIRYLGYGHWQTFQKSDGLSDGLAWQTARTSNEVLWVSTDTGIDEIVGNDRGLRLSRTFPGPAFALAVGPHGELWHGYGDKGARVLDIATGLEVPVNVPAVNQILPGSDGKMWLATQAGLFVVDDPDGVPGYPVRQSAAGIPVVNLVADGTGGILYSVEGRLRHRHKDGVDAAVLGAWPGTELDPVALAIDHHGEIWIGGGGGLCRFTMSGDRVSSYQLVSASDTRTNSILALMVDHRGWVWVGTPLGVSVYDGKRWVSVDAELGMVSDDVDQGGLREDPDGSVWITTTQGLSHLLDPEWLFANHLIRAVVSDARLGTHPVTGAPIPFTRDALTLQFGTPNYGAERSMVFSYMLSGVDEDWVTTSSGAVRYAFVPPGRHLLTVVGTDELTHGTSAPETLVVDIAYPWWRTWWAETLWLIAAAGFIYCATILRFRAIMARQAKLKRLIAEATEQLRHQAAHDSLTGLLNRFEVERLLAARLTAGPIGDELVVALVDLDHFKQVNDLHGHLAGDEVLRQLGRLLAAAMRVGEHAGRYGGEEMLLLINNIDGCAAERVAELHAAVRSRPFETAGTVLRVTCSIGLACAVRGDDWESLIGRADQALYEAKASGRDQIVESGNARTGHARRSSPSPWHDYQSGLANRALFELRLQQAFEGRGENRFALLMIQLEQLPDEACVEPPGDGVLRLLAERLGGCVRQRDTLARLVGLSFAIIQHGVSETRDAERLAVRLLGALDAPFVFDTSRCEFAASIGIAIAPEHGEEPSTLISSAASALSRMRGGPRQGFHVLSHELDQALLEGRALGRDLQDLDPDGEMELLYQPIVVIEDDPRAARSDDPSVDGRGSPSASRVIGYEALLRWNHPTRGLLMPGEFIALSEENGSIERLGAWIMMRACSDAAAWPDDLKVAINVSASQFRFGTLADHLSHALTATGIRPSRVEIEITETALLPDDDATLATLHSMQALGVQLALDDFGTGFASLSYLRSFPFDRLKIDRSFVTDLCEDEDAAAIVRAILALGRSLDISVTAEGVETTEQLERLRAEGCTQAQGFLFGRPTACPSFFTPHESAPQVGPDNHLFDHEASAPMPGRSNT